MIQANNDSQIPQGPGVQVAILANIYTDASRAVLFKEVRTIILNLITTLGIGDHPKGRRPS